MTDIKPERVVEHWSTVAVTALPPGWRNAFRIEGEDSHILYPCAAILLQEHRSTEHVRYEMVADGHARAEYRNTTDHEPPYDTVAVFAYHDTLGLLKRVWDAEDYDGTIGPGEEHLCDLEDCIERSSEPGAHDDA
jgi:hypothetical protein